MLSVIRFRLGRFSVVISSVIVALILSSLLRPLFGSFAVLFIGAVALNVWYGGLWSGLLTTLLSTIAYAYYLLLPQPSVELGLPIAIQLSEFVFIGLLLNALYAGLDRRARQVRQAAARAADRVAHIQIVTEALSKSLTISQAAEATMSQAIAALGASAGSIMMLMDGKTTLQVVNAVGYRPAALAVGLYFPLETRMPLADAVRTERPIWISSLELQTTRSPSLPADPEREAWAAVPLVFNGQTIGGMEFGFSGVQTFNDEDKAFIVLLGQKCAQAIDRARLYNEVREQRERLQVTLSSIGDAVITTDMNGRITFMNGVAETLTGWTFDDTTRSYLHDVFRIINETTRQPVEDPVAKVLRENTVVGLENHPILIAKDGTEMPIDDSGAPIRGESGTIVGIILVFRDITERRQKETALDATFQRTQDLYETCRRIGLVSSPDEVVQALLTSRYLNHASQCAVLTFNSSWNGSLPERYEVAAAFAAGRPLPGFATNGSLDGSPLGNLLSPTTPLFIEDTRTDLRLDQETRELFAPTGTQSTMIFPLTAGRRCFGALLLYFVSPQHWSQEDYRHIQIFVDQICVTMDNVRLFAAEARARLDAEQANQLKLKFLAMISHELRTPLTSIKGFATTLLATDVTWDAESQRDFVAVISEEADKLTDLIGQLLDLSRLQAGKLRIEPDARSLREIVGIAMAELESIAAQHRLVVDIAPDLPPVMVDAQRIAQVLVNLVGNAAKYAPPAGRITLSAVAREGNLQVNVGDEGPGIPVENRESVFEAFLQLENSLPHQGTGLGLGLAICKGLIEAHGGKIWVAETTSGTTMSFTVPIATPL